MIPNVGSLTNRRESAATSLRFIILAALVCLSLPPAGSATEERSRAVAREFQREHPCPSTGRTTGACPGYWRDHAAGLRRTGRGVEHAVADGRRREGEGSVGVKRLLPLAVQLKRLVLLEGRLSVPKPPFASIDSNAGP